MTETRTPEVGLDGPRPIAPHRRKIYAVTAAWVSASFLVVVVGVGTGLFPPTFTTDVVGNLLFGIPVILVPLVLLWDAPGEHRTRLDRARELTLFYLPYTAGSQIGYELIFLVGHGFNLWTPTDDPGWKWLWWQYGLADTRYTNDNNWIFGLETVGVLTGILLFAVWTRLVRRDQALEARIRTLWLAFTGVAILTSSTTVYYVSEVRSGFGDIEQGAFGFWFKFIGENVPYMVLPPLVLYAIYLQVDHFTRRAGAASMQE
ncbi:emopamil-binding protein [Mycobacterium sp. MYCO198283]|uniref:emopamil-binding protein n=1 Tax=Mycobacterium sp. MYCO198283 TaxID=2883505 RepID=UPI001E2EC45E|nr:emopamil-binding protein [Mycobacterium sp. MYCO198283]MCG5434234.1 emopamil-binding protein [Mycobacterium sp. MYCO198283]